MVIKELALEAPDIWGPRDKTEQLAVFLLMNLGLERYQAILRKSSKDERH